MWKGCPNGWFDALDVTGRKHQRWRQLAITSLGGSCIPFTSLLFCLCFVVCKLWTFGHQIIHRFDSLGIEHTPSIGSLILHMRGLVFFSIVGIDPNEAQIRNLVVKINYSGFSSFKHKYGLKSMIEQESGTTLNNFSASSFLLLTSPSIIASRFEK